ncbi:hypothetical protein N9V13_03195 [Betaproteobacteria bacterium]|nr:hypothetical protein [Betaproteobacteria bacterium]
MTAINETSYFVLKNKPSAILVIGSTTSTVVDTAIAIGKIYLCEEKSGLPCEQCKNCMLIGKNEHPDFIHFDTSSITSENIKVNDISMLSSFFKLTSNQGGTRIFSLGILENVSLTIKNALLKTIEEPPKNLKVILHTKSKNAVPLTIKSRCQIIDLRKDIKIEIGASMKKFIELDEKLVPFLFKGENIKVSDAAKACQNYEIEDILDRVILWVHDALLVAFGQNPLFFKPHKDEYLNALDSVRSVQCLLEANYNILEMKKYVFNNLNKILFIENIFMEFKNGFK